MASLLEFLQTHDEAFRSRARLASLYSDFTSQKVTNPDGYHANSIAWLRALSLASKEGLLPAQTGAGAQHDRFTLHTGEELVRALQAPDLGRPLALNAVVQDAVKNKQLVPLKQFLESKTSLYAKSWVPSAWDVVSWGLRQLGVLSEEGSTASDKLVAGDFVLIANLESTAKAVLDIIAKDCPTPTSRLFTPDLLTQHLQTQLDLPLTPTDLSVLLTHLSRDRKTLTTSSTTTTLKFHAPNSSTPEPITHEDTTTATLRSLIHSLQSQTTTLSTRVNALDAQTRTAVKSNNLASARTSLKQKKLAETTLASRSATLLQLEEVYAKIEQARDQVEVVNVMEAAGSTLRSLNERTGGVERVQDVMEGLREQMGEVDEVAGVINEGASGAVDEGEVEDELEALEKSEREAREARERAVREAEEREVEAVEDEARAEEVRKRFEALDQVGEKRKAEGEGEGGTTEETERSANKRVEEKPLE
ncbi:hypothetical protein MBLNU230_g2317t1 [Neophaeotheca triangularis]